MYGCRRERVLFRVVGDVWQFPLEFVTGEGGPFDLSAVALRADLYAPPWQTPIARISDSKGIAILDPSSGKALLSVADSYTSQVEPLDPRKAYALSSRLAIVVGDLVGQSVHTATVVPICPVSAVLMNSFSSLPSDEAPITIVINGQSTPYAPPVPAPLWGNGLLGLASPGGFFS